ncbi:hypothetical protein [Schlesneria sp. T3-172]|uniref:hypothetical protein n=1 Tax=Schlesneria sphaerica TaxID=3373610 RepID=UPI0037CB65F6
MRLVDERILYAFSLTAVLIVVYVSVKWKLHELYGPDDAYAVWGASDLVTTYMIENHDAWPRSWEDLRELYERDGARVSGWTFEEYQSRVLIDFTADPIQLRELSLQPGDVKFNVIRARWSSGMMGAGPDVDIRDYFRHKSGYTE